MPSNHMALNQGVEDQLLFDNSKSYFVDPGYERTSNFQMELVDVEPMNSAQPGQTIQFMLPQSGDLVGDLDLAFAFNTPTSVEPAANATNCISAWVESVGYAMIDYVEFTVGSTVLQRITGDQMYLMNELKQQSKRQTSQAGTTGMSAMHRTARSGEMRPWSDQTAPILGDTNDGYPGDGAWSRVLHDNNNGTSRIVEQTKEYHVPLPFFFTDSPGKYFPMAALHGVNDIRVTMRLRSLDELLHISPNWLLSGVKIPLAAPKFSGGVFKHFRLRAHYYALSGPEATALASKEQVRLIHEWQHLREIKSFHCTELGRSHKVDIDLNFLHPVKELIFVLRRSDEMSPDVTSHHEYKELRQGPATKNYFAFHGDPSHGDPNIDGLQNSASFVNSVYKTNLDVTNIKLKLNGTERHNAISDGVKREYLSDMVVARQRSPFANNDHNTMMHNLSMESSKNSGIMTNKERALAQLSKMHDAKSIFVYPLCIDAEGDNPSGSVNFSKVSHAKLSFDVTAFTGVPVAQMPEVDQEFYIDVYAVSYNWLQIRDGRALVSFA